MVYDSIPPTLSGPSSIQISYTETLTVDSIKALLNPSDNYTHLTTDDVVVVSDTFTQRTTDTGVFTIVFTVEDGAKLFATHSVEITVIDDQVPVIFVDDYIVKINPEVTFTNTDALSLLLHANILQQGDYTMQTLINEYSGNEQNPGMYLYQVSFTNQDGETYIKDFVIEVLEQDNNKEYIPLVSFFGLCVSFTVFVIIKKKK